MFYFLTTRPMKMSGEGGTPCSPYFYCRVPVCVPHGHPSSLPGMLRMRRSISFTMPLIQEIQVDLIHGRLVVIVVWELFITTLSENLSSPPVLPHH